MCYLGVYMLQVGAANDALLVLGPVVDGVVQVAAVYLEDDEFLVEHSDLIFDGLVVERHHRQHVFAAVLEFALDLLDPA